ncbi:hypothetical protein SLEP1_g18611 [Rubroshorea leprosula]|uniref:Uncharacterized protein n=1 Tax=Rubroshorea leprosula TaxID=152421 RepID=A0AAV5IY50_9ROSI|nr:hypothetical protein SLEP1_g18611 [Rubroshorea leprosula]
MQTAGYQFSPRFDFCLLVAHKFPMITTDVTSKALIWSFHNSFFR